MAELERFTQARTQLKSLLDSKLQGDRTVEHVEAWLESEQRGSLVKDKHQQERMYSEASFRKNYEDLVSADLKEAIDKERKGRVDFKERLLKMM